MIILAFVKSEGKQKQEQVRSKRSAGNEHSGSEGESSESLVSTSPASYVYLPFFIDLKVAKTGK